MIFYTNAFFKLSKLLLFLKQSWKRRFTHEPLFSVFLGMHFNLKNNINIVR